MGTIVEIKIDSPKFRFITSRNILQQNKAPNLGVWVDRCLTNLRLRLSKLTSNRARCELVSEDKFRFTFKLELVAVQSNYKIVKNLCDISFRSAASVSIIKIIQRYELKKIFRLICAS